jgi:N-acetylmuramoyl-L-alanine amidase CwlA
VYNHNQSLIQQALPVIKEPVLSADDSVKDVIEKLNDRQKTVTEPEKILSPSVDLPQNETQKQIESLIIKKEIDNQVQNVTKDKDKKNTEIKTYSDDRIENLLHRIER